MSTDTAPFTAADIDAAVGKLADNHYDRELTRADLVEVVQIVLTSAATRGRLLPVDGVTATEWRTTWQWIGADKPDGPDGPLAEETARALYEQAQLPQLRTQAATLYRREVRTWPDGSQHIGPWQVVESFPPTPGEQ